MRSSLCWLVTFGLVFCSLELEARSKFEEKEVCFASGSLKMAGILSLPKAAGRYPGLVLVHESGPVDRDESWGKDNGTFREIAHCLAEKGIVVLRYDTRGVGKSQGNFLTAGLYDFGLDASSALDHLNSVKEVDPGRRFILGHGYGGKVATIAATRTPGIAGIIQFAGLLEKEPEHQRRVMRFQHEVDRVEPKDSRKIFADHRYFVHNVIAGRYHLLDDYFKDPVLAEWIKQAMVVNPQPPLWWRDNILFDPVRTLRGTQCPVLILLGECDWLIDEKSLRLELLKLKKLGKRNVELAVFPGLNHRFIWMASRRKAYQFEKALVERPCDTSYPIASSVVEKVASWIFARANEEKRRE